MRRFFSLLIVLSVIFSMNLASAATSPDKKVSCDEDNAIIIRETPNGEWNMSTSYGRDEKSIEIYENNRYENIYESNDNVYFQKIDDDTYIPVERISEPLTNYNSYLSFRKYGVPEEVLKDIASMAAFAKENQCNDAKVVLFVTSPDNSATLTTTSLPKTFPKTTTTWNGMTFHHYQAYFEGMWTTWQTIAQAGATTAATLNAIKTLTAVSAGFVSGPIGVAANLYSAGSSCLNAWKTATGKTPIYGATQNTVMADIQYNMYLKYTYYYDPFQKRDCHGCSSQKAYVTQIDTDTYLYTSTGGKRVEGTVHPYKYYKTPHYDAPEATAYDHHMAGVVERVQGKVYNKTILFSYPNFTWPSDWP